MTPISVDDWESQDHPFRIESARRFLLAVANRLMGQQLKGCTNVSDVVHETLLAAIRDIQQFRGRSEGELREWLVAVLKHRMVDEARKLAVRNRGGAVQELTPETLSIASDSSGPLSTAIQREQFDRLMEAVSTLPEVNQQIVCMRYVDGWTFEQIANELNMSRDSVRRAWLKSLKDIGNLLG